MSFLRDVLEGAFLGLLFLGVVLGGLLLAYWFAVFLVWKLSVFWGA